VLWFSTSSNMGASSRREGGYAAAWRKNPALRSDSASLLMNLDQPSRPTSAAACKNEAGRVVKE
jgi:hypothetical protein